jgi:hypothetical protein
MVSSGDRVLRKPTIGHAVTPPRSVMNSRRLMGFALKPRPTPYHIVEREPCFFVNLARIATGEAIINPELTA